MALKPITIAVPAHDFERCTAVTRRKVKSIGRQYDFTQHETASKTYTMHNAGFEITIDIPAIVDKIVARAKRSKRLRAIGYGSRIKCKAVEVKQVSQRVQVVPLREGFVLVEPEAGK